MNSTEALELWNERNKNVYSVLEAEPCDRRMSRAARRLLEKHLRLRENVEGQTTASRNNFPRGRIGERVDIWTMLEDWLRDATAAECPLFPSRDLWRHDEESSISLKPPGTLKGAYPASTITQRRKYSKRPQHWWKCGYCGKAFATRYYLDVHLQSQHHAPHMAGEVDRERWVCPANEWCRVVGLANCHEQALREEPYYGRGSGGWGFEDGLHALQQEYKRAARMVPCDIQKIQADCREILGSCRVSDMGLCDSLACPHQSQHLWGDHWDDIWLAGNHLSPLTILLGIVIFFVLLGWFFYMIIYDIPVNNQESNNRRIYRDRHANLPPLEKMAFRTSPQNTRPFQRGRLPMVSSDNKWD